MATLLLAPPLNNADMNTKGLTKLTAMHHQHLALGAMMDDYDGWQRPSRYTSAEVELEAVREAAGLSDISPLGKFVVQGSDVAASLSTILRGAPTEAGGVAECSLERADVNGHAPILVSRLADTELFVTSAPESASSLGASLSESLAGCAHIVDMTSGLAAINVAGPASSRIIAKLTDLDMSSRSLLDLSCAQGMLAEVHAIIVRRDRGSLPSYDIYFGRDFGEYLWEVMVEAGHEYGMAPIGVEALKELAEGR